MAVRFYLGDIRFNSRVIDDGPIDLLVRSCCRMEFGPYDHFPLHRIELLSGFAKQLDLAERNLFLVPHYTRQIFILCSR
ncbi:hypothetical protein D3C77_590240 [compost metagenome]